MIGSIQSKLSFPLLFDNLAVGWPNLCCDVAESFYLIIQRWLLLQPLVYDSVADAVALSELLTALLFARIYTLERDLVQ